jgi:hypothetical protein
MPNTRLGHLGPFPWKHCPQCDKRWPLASYRDMELCFQCRNKVVSS